MIQNFHLSASDLGQFLIDGKYLTQSIVEQVIKESNKNDIPLLTYLGQERYLSYLKLAEITALYFDLPVYDIQDHSLVLPTQILNIDFIKKYSVLPIEQDNDQIVLAISDPSTLDLNELHFLLTRTIKLVIVPFDVLANKIAILCSNALQSELEEKNNVAQAGWTDANIQIKANQQDLDSHDAPTVIFVNKILLDAIQQNASDIHFEPYQHFYRIRFRMDGLLYEMCNPSPRTAEHLIARLKVLANLDLAERRLPQDGRFKLHYAEVQAIDFRLSTCPTLYGEKAVVRILVSASNMLNMDVLGFEDEQLAIFNKSISQPQGMILVTGPTGSGKTMTLYAALNKLNSTHLNIVTIEDPIEIPLPGINQVQVNMRTGLTFSKTLRAFLRQDPDIIMIGEIRDSETADTAIRAAHTGHLVMSTLHTNSAVETITRLLNMGVSPINLASSVTLIIAQRLVRKICHNCKAILDQTASCQKCQNGYQGRTAIFEMLLFTDEVRQMIASKMSHIKLAENLRELNTLTLHESANIKVQRGVTTFTEINRMLGT